VRRREAVCSCGQLRVTTESDPVRISMCHCLACQRRTGSAFGMQARWRKDRVDVTGRYTEYVRISDAWRGADVSLLPGLRSDALLDDRRLAGLDRGPNRRVRR
jgi:Glutathione-dependent formaldehyde-activating enzyme